MGARSVPAMRSRSSLGSLRMQAVELLRPVEGDREGTAAALCLDYRMRCCSCPPAR